MHLRLEVVARHGEYNLPSRYIHGAIDSPGAGVIECEGKRKNLRKSFFNVFQKQPCLPYT